VDKKIKAYSGSGTDGSAILVFAYNRSQAKKLTHSFYDDHWIDIRVKWMKGCDWLTEQAISDSPHIIDSPASCRDCGEWGQSKTGEDQLCDECRKQKDFIGDYENIRGTL